MKKDRGIRAGSVGVAIAVVVACMTTFDEDDSADVTLVCSPTCIFCHMAVDSLREIARTIPDISTSYLPMAWTEVDRSLGALLECTDESTRAELFSALREGSSGIVRADNFELIRLARRMGVMKPGLTACVDTVRESWESSPSGRLLAQLPDTVSPTFVIGDTVVYGLYAQQAIVDVIRSRQ